MPQPSSTPTKPDATALSAAFEALETYDQGSSRGALVPIDEAIMASLDDKATQKELEKRLLVVLARSGSPVAREYICSKLTLIGSDRCVSALAPLLNTPEFATAARNALERIPGRQATKVLSKSLSKVQGSQKVGVINSLGARRDSNSVRALAALLKSPDLAIAGPAAAALGEIATTQAAGALRNLLPRVPEAIRLQTADAILTCAERMLAADKRTDARKLYEMLTSKALPDHVQLAAARGIELVVGKR